MFRKIVLAAPIAGAMALWGPIPIAPAHAAQFPHAVEGASSALLTLVQVRKEDEDGGRGKGGGGGPGGGVDRGGRRDGGGNAGNRGNDRPLRDNNAGKRGNDRPPRDSNAGNRGNDRPPRDSNAGNKGNDRPRDGNTGNNRPPRDGNAGGKNDGRGGHDRQRIRRFGRHYSWGPGIEFYFYNGYYYGDCAWLKRRAIATGSSYWWRRFRVCRAYSW